MRKIAAVVSSTLLLAGFVWYRATHAGGEPFFSSSKRARVLTEQERSEPALFPASKSDAIIRPSTAPFVTPARFFAGSKSTTALGPDDLVIFGPTTTQPTLFGSTKGGIILSAREFGPQDPPPTMQPTSAPVLSHQP
jgi:hypothetical protein